MESEPIKTIKDLKIYKAAYSLALRIHTVSNEFPIAERFSLTDQIRRSSRSVAINIREGFAKRRYPAVFVRHLNDAIGSSEETRGWLEFSRDANYLSHVLFNELDPQYDALNAMIYGLIQAWNGTNHWVGEVSEVSYDEYHCHLTADR